MKKPYSHCELSFSAHAMERYQQRGFRPDDFDALLDFGDEVNVGGGCVSITLSNKAFKELDPEDRARAERARHKAFVAAGNHVVTVCNTDTSDAAQRLRSGLKADGHPHRPRQKRHSQGPRFDTPKS